MSNNQHDGSSFEEQLHTLEQQYVLCEPEKVLQLLRGEPSLVSPLLTVYPRIAEQFPDVQVFLHAVDNPEPYHVSNQTGRRQRDEQEGQQEIAAFISTSLEPKEAIQRLTVFYQSHWGQVLRATHGKIAVGLECL